MPCRWREGGLGPFTGRVLVMLTQGGGEPRRGPDWFNPQPFFAVDVKDWKPGEILDEDRAPRTLFR